MTERHYDTHGTRCSAVARIPAASSTWGFAVLLPSCRAPHAAWQCTNPLRGTPCPTTVDAALGVGNDHERFPVGIEKYLTLRYYTLLHNELYGVCENDP